MAWISFENLGLYHQLIKDWVSNNIHANKVIQDDKNKFVTNEQINNWNGKLDSNANAVSASKLQNPIKINGVDFDGTKDIEIGSLYGGAVFKELKYYVKLTPNSTVINMPIEFTKQKGFLSVYIDGIKQIESIHYTADFKAKSITILSTFKNSIDVELIFLYAKNVDDPDFPQLDKLVIDLNKKSFIKNKIGDCKLYNRENLLTNFGESKLRDYTENDLCCNNEEGFFFIGRNQESIYIDVKELDLFNTTKKLSVEFQFSQTDIADEWSNPLFLTSIDQFIFDPNETQFRVKKGVRLEWFNKNGGIYFCPSPFADGTDGSIKPVGNIDNSKHSIIIMIENTTAIVYLDYTKVGECSIHEIQKINYIGLNKGNTTKRCCNMKIYGLKVWKDTILTEQEIEYIKKVGEN